jgi:DNA modification methylase
MLETDKIFAMDCLELMGQLPENVIDLTVTSPPYNVGIDYENHIDNMSEDDYFAFIQSVSDELYRISKVGGRACINIPFIGNSKFKAKSEKLIFYPNMYMPIFEKSGWIIRDFVVWVKSSEAENPNNFCGNSTQWGSWLSPSCPYMRCFAEVILVFHKINKRLDHKGISDLTKDEFMEYTKNVWYFKTANNTKDHPAQFPIELPKRCIKLYSYQSDLVFDPFMGLGNTALACVETNRHYLGCDISQEYANTAISRIRDLIQDRYVNYSRMNAEACSCTPRQFHINHRD